jgi:aryl-alcohol dehydrogenase-like predicted oxidoreductase
LWHESTAPAALKDLLHVALDNGITLIDIADIYGVSILSTVG